MSEKVQGKQKVRVIPVSSLFDYLYYYRVAR
jgi:hypothetical protein